MKKWITLAVLSFVLLLQGCAFNSFMFEAKENKPIIIIEHPPNRVAYGGNLNEEDMAHLQEVLTTMQRMPYKDHHYNNPLGVNVHADLKRTNSSTFSGASTITKKENKNVQKHNSNTDVTVP